MKYMFMLFNEEPEAPTAPPTPEETAAMMAPWEAFNEQAAKLAPEVSGAALQPSATATTVSVRNGATVTTDGPFADTKEQLGGYYIFDCKDLDQAIEIATLIPWAPTGHIEVRPVMEFE